ncbi:histidine kinase N-terminal 7TM domain-containing diguanylate cyclase [Gilvimarinus algae]|uniref:diguanylate cyclase n=1 Tax=Gilvimarinus algae TaxID=3058037 RepID=A0ABT8TH75_9GAMM|nr:histidine kinase N-terminal 7TM domain-containing protein [Gilvimarinus sp. SDUM040014]MDO3383449.1 histidine kinase N-terminal 7TM domain-containing protein [Gilvimarinus sp. SDUM040014]
MSDCSWSSWQWSPEVSLALAVWVGIGGLIVWIARQSNFPGKYSFMLTHAASLWWILAAAAELAAQLPGCKMFLAAMAWPGIVLMPSLWALFLWQYVNSDYRLPKASTLARVSIAPFIFWALALTNPWHHLFYTAASAPVSSEPGAPIAYQHGPLFYMAAIYVYGFMLASTGILLHAALGSNGLYRRHYLAFVLVTLIPWAANISYVFFQRSLFGFDPTPFTFALSLAAFIWLIRRAQLFDVIPLARHLLLEALPDPVLVIDRQNRVVDANPAALQLADLPKPWQARAVRDWPGFGSALGELINSENDSPVSILKLEPDRFYEARVMAIKHRQRRQAQTLGKMIYLREITDQHKAQLQLSRALALSKERLRTISQLHEELQAQAIRDPLTRLYNRRFLDELFTRELRRAERDQAPLALAVIDIDHFKALNDRYGHPVGDEVLVYIGEFLRTQLRESDGIFRIGGEEFLVILPGLTTEQAQQRMSYICQRFAQKPITTREGFVSASFSGGVAAFPSEGHHFQALMDKADAALYQAKAEGRNRIVRASNGAYAKP